MSIISSTNYAEFRLRFEDGVGYENDGLSTIGLFPVVPWQPFSGPPSSFPIPLSPTTSIGVDPSADAVDWEDEMHWWLCDQSAVSGDSAVRMQLNRSDVTSGGFVTSTRSRAATLSLTTAGSNYLTVFSEELLKPLLWGAHIYALDIDNAVIYWADLYRCAYSPSTF